MFIKRLYLVTLFFTISSIYAAPVFSTSQMTETGHALTETLSGFYETVIDQVMLDVSEDILKYIPSSISHENIQGNNNNNNKKEFLNTF